MLDNPRVLILAALLLVACWRAVLAVRPDGRTSRRSVCRRFSSTRCWRWISSLLLALCFVLARNLLKLWVEQRQAAPFARFRAKLVAALLAMTIIPAVLVLVSGSEIIRNIAARWFSQPVDEVLTGAKTIASRYYMDQVDQMMLRARQLARTVPASAIAAGDEAGVTAAIAGELATMSRA